MNTPDKPNSPNLPGGPAQPGRDTPAPGVHQRFVQPGQGAPGGPPSAHAPAYEVAKARLVPGTPRRQLSRPGGTILFEEGLFKDRADYNRTVAGVVARIKKGEIQPREPDSED